MSQEDTINENVHRILFILEGTTATDKGLVGRVSKQEERIAKLEKFNTKLIYMLVGISFGLGVSLGKLISLLHH